MPDDQTPAAETSRQETYNERVIREFRAARDAGETLDRPVVLIHHRGRKTGTERVNPVAYLNLEGAWAIFASKGGGPQHPEWYLNLMAHPQTTVEVGSDTVAVLARAAGGEERTRIWEEQKRVAPRFAEYEEKAKVFPREIPVVILEMVS